jgi:hypothetical protein
MALWPVAIRKLRDQVLFPATPGTPGNTAFLPGWEFSTGQWARLRMVARQGGFGALKLHAGFTSSQQMEVVLGVLISTITAMADVFERQLALHSARITELEKRASRKPGAESAEDSAARVERQRVLFDEAGLDSEDEAPSTLTVLRSLRFAERLGKSREAPVETESAAAHE